MIRTYLFLQCDRCGVVKEIDEPEPGKTFTLPVGWVKHWNIVLCDKHKMWIEIRVKDNGNPSERLNTNRVQALAIEMSKEAFAPMVVDGKNQADPGVVRASNFVDHLKRLKLPAMPRTVLPPKKKRKIVLEEPVDDDIPW